MEILNTLANRGRVISGVAELLTKLLEKFVLVHCVELSDYVNLDGLRLKVNLDFYEDLRYEQEEIGETILADSPAHQTLLGSKYLHAKIFSYCKSVQISSEQYLKIAQLRATVPNIHNLPSILDETRFRDTVQRIRSAYMVDRTEIKRYVDFQLIETLLDALLK